jgi:hypothetical protein
VADEAPQHFPAAGRKGASLNVHFAPIGTGAHIDFLSPETICAQTVRPISPCPREWGRLPIPYFSQQTEASELQKITAWADSTSLTLDGESVDILHRGLS